MNSPTMPAGDMRRFRQPAVPIQDALFTRWSPRAMSGEPITDDELRTLLEAARWAPSSTNSQPWRFVYARRDTPHWNAFFDLLTEGNRRWADKGALLAIVLSLPVDPRNGKVLRTHSYDAGAAWQNIALQGHALGLVVHGMQGFDYDRARSLAQVPAEVTVEAMFVVGRPGRVEDMAEDLQKREIPSDRRPVAELAFEGAYVAPPVPPAA